MRLSEAPFISATDLDVRIGELASDLDEAYASARPLMLTVLKGGKPFADSLARNLTIPFDTESIRARSYDGTESTGTVNIEFDTTVSIKDRDVIVVEDILDTGRTAAALVNHLKSFSPASLRMVTLLDKPSRRVAPIQADWVGFTIEDHFVVGFGMDYNEAYRELDDIRILEPDGPLSA